jgi:hypothetical protein
MIRMVVMFMDLSPCLVVGGYRWLRREAQMSGQRRRGRKEGPVPMPFRGDWDPQNLPPK